MAHISNGCLLPVCPENLHTHTHPSIVIIPWFVDSSFVVDCKKGIKVVDASLSLALWKGKCVNIATPLNTPMMSRWRYQHHLYHMAEHKDKFYKYDEALKLKHPKEDAIAKTHNARPSKKVTLAQANDD